MGGNCKFFSGSIPYEKLAARIYDRFALQHFGLRSKINLSYTKSQLSYVIDEIDEQIDDQLMNSRETESLHASSSLNVLGLHPSDMITLRGKIPLNELNDEEE